MPLFSKADIAAVLEKAGLENSSAKSVRIGVEERLGLEPGALKSERQAISEMIDEVIAEMPPAAAEEAEDEEPKAKKAKKESSKAADDEDGDAGGGGGGGKSFTCQTRSGEECPKKIKEMQSKLMTANKFLQSGKTLQIDVDGNTLTGDPRSFQSGNLGWYLTGKVEIEVGGQTVWAQVGMNVTIPGSSTWKR